MNNWYHKLLVCDNNNKQKIKKFEYVYIYGDWIKEDIYKTNYKINRIIKLDIQNNKLKNKELIDNILIIIELLKTIETDEAIDNILTFNKILELIEIEKNMRLEIDGINYSFCSTYVNKLYKYNNIFCKNVFNIKSLITLDLSNQNINILPKEIGNLIKLENLFLNNNKLKKIPNEIKKCQRLRSIYLNNNRLKYIDYGLSLIPSLTYIDISNVRVHPNFSKKIHIFHFNYNIKLIKLNRFKDNCYIYYY